MPKFWVTTTDTETRRYLVEADTEENAMERVLTSEDRIGVPSEFVSGDYTVDECKPAPSDVEEPPVWSRDQL